MRESWQARLDTVNGEIHTILDPKLSWIDMREACDNFEKELALLKAVLHQAYLPGQIKGFSMDMLSCQTD